MDAFNQWLNAIAKLPFGLLENMRPCRALVLSSLLTGICILLVYRLTSNQEAVSAVKNRIKAHFLGIRLYRDNLRVVLSVWKSLLKDNLVYLRLSLKPTLFLILPVALIMVQMEMRFDRKPLEPGESGILKVRFKGASHFDENTRIDTPEGLQVTAPALRIPTLCEIDWRVRGLQAGDWTVRIETETESVEKAVRVGKPGQPLSPMRVAGGSVMQLRYPLEKGIPADSSIASITFEYPPGRCALWGITLHWMLIFFAVSIVSVLLLKKPFRTRL